MKTKINQSSLVIILFLTIFFIACENKKMSESSNAAETVSEEHAENENTVEVTPAQYKAIGIQLGTAEMKSISGLLKVNGYIDVPPQNLVSITTQMGGIVKSTPLLQGSSVKKGQVIAVLENQDYVQLQQDYLESKSQLELSQAEYQRQQTLASQQVNSQKTVQQARSQYQIAQARESALRQRLQLINISATQLTASTIRSRINIYAPVSGYVTKVNVNGGKFVNPNDVMFEIVDGSELHVELNVFEKDAAQLRQGQRVRFTLAGENTEQIAHIQLVGREIRADKTVTVHAIAGSGSKSFLPGAYLKALIETEQHKTKTLPESAVVDFNGKSYIFAAVESPVSAHQHQEAERRADKEGQESIANEYVTEKNQVGSLHYFEMIEVTTGNSDAGFVQVTLPGGRNLDGKIVTSGTYDLLSKLKNSEEHEGH